MSYTKENIQEFSPMSGSTINVANADTNISVQIDATNTLTTLGVNMPSDPWHGQRLVITTSKTITLLSIIVSGVTLLGAVTSLLANSFSTWQYSKKSQKWFKVG